MRGYKQQSQRDAVVLVKLPLSTQHPEMIDLESPGWSGDTCGN